jgi:hypothetical protein
VRPLPLRPGASRRVTVVVAPHHGWSWLILAQGLPLNRLSPVRSAVRSARSVRTNRTGAASARRLLHSLALVHWWSFHPLSSVWVPPRHPVRTTPGHSVRTTLSPWRVFRSWLATPLELTRLSRRVLPLLLGRLLPRPLVVKTAFSAPGLLVLVLLIALRGAATLTLVSHRGAAALTLVSLSRRRPAHR